MNTVQKLVQHTNKIDAAQSAILELALEVNDDKSLDNTQKKNIVTKLLSVNENIKGVATEIVILFDEVSVKNNKELQEILDRLKTCIG